MAITHDDIRDALRTVKLTDIEWEPGKVWGYEHFGDPRVGPKTIEAIAEYLLGPAPPSTQKRLPGSGKRPPG